MEKRAFGKAIIKGTLFVFIIPFLAVILYGISARVFLSKALPNVSLAEVDTTSSVSDLQ